MPLPFILALRNERHTVKLVRPNGSPRPVLGTQSPEEDDRRAMIAERLQIGGHSARPRTDKPVGIEEALPVRSQTILSYRLPREVRDLVNGGVDDAIPSSRKTQENIGIRIDLKLE